MRDITNVEELHRLLQHAQRMELMGRLAAGLSHDLNNALTIILSHADLLAFRGEAPDPADLADIRAAALHASALTRQLLCLGRQRRGPGLVTDVDVNGALGALYRLMRRVLGEEIAFACVPSRVAASVYVDPVRLDQALINLVFNARDAIRERGFIRVTAEYVGTEDAASVVFRVSDNGDGMTPDVVERAFEPCFTTKHDAGSGLGLAMLRDFVNEAGGAIAISTEPNFGTTIEFSLPARMAIRAELDDTGPRPFSGTETVIVVEDDAAVRDSISRILHDAGYTVLEVPTVLDGVWLSDELLSRASLVIADEGLPDSSGHELIASFRHRKRNLPVLYISGHPVTSEIARRLDEQTRFLPKPFDQATLLREVRRLLDRDEARAE